MFFAVLIFHLIFSVGFSSMSLHRLSKRETEGSNRELIDSSNQTSSLENKTEKSYLEEYLRLKHRYLLKNHIDDFETHFGLHFTPNWTIVDHYSSLARQCVEIRRQKWEYMLENFNGSHAIARLNSELQNTAINRTTFCKHIAEIYSVLSDNRYVFDDDASCGQNLEGLKFVRNPLHEMSAKTFMSSISNSKGRSEDEEVIQLPKSLYIDLIRKDAHAAAVKQHHKDEMKRSKNEYRNKIRQARDPWKWPKEI